MVVVSDSDEMDEETMEEEPVASGPMTPGEELEEWLPKIQDYAPLIPDALTVEYFKAAGFQKIDPRFVRLVSLSAQKFIADIANDALVHCKSRNQHSSSHGANKDKKLTKDKKYVVQMEDVLPAIQDHGITVRKPQYFV